MPSEQSSKTESGNIDFNAIGFDHYATSQSYERRFDVVRYSVSKLFRDLTTTFDQLALVRTAVRFGVDGIEDRFRVGEKCPQSVHHQVFQIACRYAPAIRTVRSCAGKETSRNIVPISRSLLDRICRCQPLAGLVKY